MKEPRKWEAVDYIVAMLALAVSVITVGAVVGVLVRNQPMHERQAEIMSTVISAIISIVSMYVGAAIQKHKDK